METVSPFQCLDFNGSTSFYRTVQRMVFVSIMSSVL